jgi:hypothetical protein
MTEIRTEQERLVVRSAPILLRGASEPAHHDDRLMLHRYGPLVEIQHASAMGGLAPSAAAAPARAAHAGLTFAEQLGVAAFNLRSSSGYRSAKARRPRDGELWDTRGCMPSQADTPAREALFPAGAPTTHDAPAPGAAMLVGSVAVGVVIVNGPTAATQFTEEERVKVVAEVQAGLTWLGTQEPAAGVSWSYEINNVSIPTAVDSSAEDDESRWRNPAMGQLGHRQDWQGVLDYVQAMRTRLGTRSAYCAFFVKGYPLWHFAYASAPRIVMDFANDGWGPDNIDRVFAHETGHIFSCPDEYAAAACVCTSQHGIYDEPNSNCATCAPGGGISCLMKANDWAMCSHTRRHLGWGLGSTRVPQGAPVHVVSRAPDKLDIFFADRDGKVMSAAWEPALPNGWEGFWHLQGGLTAPGAPVTAVSRGLDKLDIFVVGTDNHVYTAAWRPDSGGWVGYWKIGDLRVPHRTAIHAVSRSADKLDIFVTDELGRVMTAAWEPAFADGWHGWQHIANGYGAPGAPVTAAVRSADKLDIFVVGTDGHAYTAAWEPDGSPWRGWWRIGSARFPAQAALHAVSRGPDQLDIFATANGGEVVSAAWQPSFTDGWHGWWHIREGRAPAGSPVHAVSRGRDKLDIFVTGGDGALYTAAWEPAFSDGWHGWWDLNGGRAVPGAPMPVASRATDKLDVFVVGTDSRIFTAAWQPDFASWAGWWPLGA